MIHLAALSTPRLDSVVSVLIEPVYNNTTELSFKHPAELHFVIMPVFPNEPFPDVKKTHTFFFLFPRSQWSVGGPNSGLLTGLTPRSTAATTAQGY